MKNKTGEEFLSAKHKRLLRFASIANLFAWIIFVFQILSAGSSILAVYRNYVPQYLNIYPGVLDFLTAEPVTALKLIVEPVSILLLGMVYGLVLKGISLGLNMIVETDINYREKYLVGENE